MSEDETPKPAEIDERWMPEWIEAGLRDLDRSLKNHAAFAEWLLLHDKETPE